MSGTDHHLNQSHNSFSNQNLRCNNHSKISGDSFDWLLVSLSDRFVPLYIAATIAIAAVCLIAYITIQHYTI